VSGLEQLGGLIDAMLGRWGIGDTGVFVAIRDRWSEIAGPQWSVHARPTMLRTGVLTVEASHGAATILRYASGSLLAALQDEFGENAITGINIKTTGQPTV
jgi:predicted nucleic acid-binding Zn ribbon protein